MPTRPADTRFAKAVPVEFAGKWVAWNAEHARIVAHAESLQQLWRVVREENIQDPVFEKVPRADVRFVGMR
jgi:hypothetical protein